MRDENNNGSGGWSMRDENKGGLVGVRVVW